MYKNKSFLAIIPARAGSKRLPRKNVRPLHGKPLIAWSIEAGLKSKYIDEVMVTTDDDEIAEISQRFGANVPFKRPLNLATDYASRAEVIKHTLDFYQFELKKEFDYLVFLQPTSPLRNYNDIDSAIEYLFSKNGDAVVSICELEHPIHWCGKLPEDRSMSSFLDLLAINSRSQDLDKFYRLNGAIYICDIKKFLEEGDVFLKDNIFGFVMSHLKSVDIDAEFDFKLTEFLIVHND